MRALGVLAVVFTLLARPALAGPPAEFHGGPERTGIFEGPGPDGFFKLAWRFDAGHMVVASPVVADGVLFAGARNGVFYALDAKSGALRWKFAADAPITATAAVADGIAYFISASNTIYALNAADGALVWKRTTGADLPFDAMAGFAMVQDWDYWSSSPLAYEGRVCVGSGDGKIYALDAKTGAVIWRHATAGRVRSSPATDGKTIYVGSFDGTMRALDIASGKPRWVFHTKGNPVFPAGSIQSSPALAGGLVIFGARDYNLYALDAKSGREVWEQSVKNSWVPSTPAIADGQVYVGSADGRALLAYDLATGKPLWTTPLDNLVFSSPVIVGDSVYIATLGGTVFGLKRNGGGIFGFTLTQDRVLSTPWIENGTLYFGNNDGYIYAMTAGPKKFPGG